MPVAERGAEHVAAAVQVEEAGPRLVGRRDEQRADAARADGTDGDLRRRGELRVQRLVGVAHRVDVGAGLGQVGERLPHAHAAAHELAADRLRHGDRLVDPAQDAPGPVEQRLAGQRQLDLVRGAPEQLDADELLERADLPAQRRLRQVQLLGGAPEVELLGDGDERAQVPELDGVRRAREGQYPFLVHAPGLSPSLPRALMRILHDGHKRSAFPFRGARVKHAGHAVPDRRPAPARRCADPRHVDGRGDRPRSCVFLGHEPRIDCPAVVLAVTECRRRVVSSSVVRRPRRRAGRRPAPDHPRRRPQRSRARGRARP